MNIREASYVIGQFTSRVNPIFTLYDIQIDQVGQSIQISVKFIDAPELGAQYLISANLSSNVFEIIKAPEDLETQKFNSDVSLYSALLEYFAVLGKASEIEFRDIVSASLGQNITSWQEFIGFILTYNSVTNVIDGDHISFLGYDISVEGSNILIRGKLNCVLSVKPVQVLSKLLELVDSFCGIEGVDLKIYSDELAQSEDLSEDTSSEEVTDDEELEVTDEPVELTDEELEVTDEPVELTDEEIEDYERTV